MPTPISALTVPLNGTAHFTVADSLGNDIPPSEIQWSGDMGNVVSRTVDATGFIFHGLNVGSVALIYSLIGSNPLITGTLTVNVTTTITGIEGISP